MYKRLLIACIYVFFFLVCAQTFFSVYKTIVTLQPDFSIFYNSSKDILRGISPYSDTHLFTVFNYPLGSLLPFIPLSFFSLQAAQLVFTTCNILSLVGCILLCFKLLKKPIPFYLFLFVLPLTLLSFPTKFTFGMGQTNLVALFFLLLGVWLQKKRSGLALVGFFLSLVFKPILLLVLIPFLLLRKKWKQFFASVLMFVILNITTSFLFLHKIVLFPQENLFNFAGREVYYNQGLLGTISRFVPNGWGREVGYFCGTALILAIILYKILQKPSSSFQLAIFLTGLTLIDPLSWQHHFVFLLFPFIFALSVLKRRQLTILLVSYLFISLNLKSPQSVQGFFAPLILSHVFLGNLMLFFLLLLTPTGVMESSPKEEK